LAFAAGADEPKETAMTMTLASRAFKEGAMIPKQHTGEGADVSPALSWSNAPAGTAAFVLVCDDPDAPVGNWVHWVLYDIPADLAALDEGVPRKDTVLGSAKQGRTDFRNNYYQGPMPPPGKPHRYVFKLYAIDRATGLPPGATKEKVLKAIEGHVLAEAQLMGLYQRGR
jgi:Raf kinase inhibitor-like YbhB/YbcL family protein